MKVLVIDPPEGWLYGFPRKAPSDWNELNINQKNTWFLIYGYPQKLIEKGYLDYCRYWYEEEEKNTEES